MIQSGDPFRLTHDEQTPMSAFTRSRMSPPTDAVIESRTARELPPPSSDQREDSPRRPRLMIIAQYYAPEPNWITNSVAEAAAGSFDVTVITAHPNYPGGRFYPGSRYWRPEVRRENDVTVVRVPMIPDHSRSVVRRAVSFISFTFSAWVAATILWRRADIVWVYQTPPSSGLIGAWLRLIRRSRVVFTYVDLWPESFIAADVLREGRVSQVVKHFRVLINRFADVVVGSTRGTVRRLAHEGVPESALRHIPVWVDGIPSLSDVPDDGVAERTARIVYAGNIGPCQYLQPIIGGVAAACSAGSQFELHLFGSGSDEAEMRDDVQRLGLTNVQFRGRISPDQAFAVSASATAQIVALRPGPMFRDTVPSKLAFCFAAGAPVIYALEGESAELVEEVGGGVRYDPAAPESFAAAVDAVCRMSQEERGEMRQRLRAFYLRHFHRDQLLSAYIDMFKTCANTAAR
jgi:colanic acid biosynthesis glycosyl transferase WcaI